MHWSWRARVPLRPYGARPRCLGQCLLFVTPADQVLFWVRRILQEAPEVGVFGGKEGLDDHYVDYLDDHDDHDDTRPHPERAGTVGAAHEVFAGQIRQLRPQDRAGARTEKTRTVEEARQAVEDEKTTAPELIPDSDDHILKTFEPEMDRFDDAEAP